MAAEAARVFCEGDSVRVLTLRVGSRPAGMYLAVDNRLEGNADLSVSHSGGGMGWSVPNQREPARRERPTPKIEFDCHSRSWRKDMIFAMEVGP